MEKTILISETAKETRVAILENGELVEFFVEKIDKNLTIARQTAQKFRHSLGRL